MGLNSAANYTLVQGTVIALRYTLAIRLGEVQKIDIQQNISLRTFNTLGLDVSAQYFARVECIEDLFEALDFARAQSLQVFVLGGGSNVVLHQDVTGLCLHVAIMGFKQRGASVEVGAGEAWHDLVMRTIRSGLFGLENLSLIPGQAGAAPIQNIGAYGVELAERLVSLTLVDIQTSEVRVLTAADCEFGYRDSVFKNKLKDQTVITSIDLALDTNFSPRLEYGGVQAYLEQHNLQMNAASVSQAVCAIRYSKLPDPKMRGNVGSFFKNPVVSADVWHRLKTLDNNMPGHPDVAGKQKLSAAYLIEQAGLKGRSVGGAMVSLQHALVIENTGTASGRDVLALAREVQKEVKTRFDITLDIEPRVITA